MSGDQRACAGDLKPGDHVTWKAPVPGGRTEGDVVVRRRFLYSTEIVTHDTTVGSNHFKASESDPKVRVRSSKSGKEAVHKPCSVEKIGGGEAEGEEEEGEEEEQEEADEEDAE